ncbi:MAG: PKD-like family lipoprotein [Mangrovibacterium sp.]
MKNKQKTLVLVVLFLALLPGLQSCYKDLGNYDYDTLPDIKISEIQTYYGEKRLFEDTLVINPVITYGEEGNESFTGEWFRVTNDTIFTSITQTIDLTYPMNISGSNVLFFRATHKETGLMLTARSRVSVVSQMERGFYILKETADGNTDVDGFTRNTTTKELDEYPNLITKNCGNPLEGAPVNIDYWNWLNRTETGSSVTVESVRAIRPMSEKELAIFDIKSFLYLGDLNSMLYDPLPTENLKLEHLSSCTPITTLIYNGGKIQALKNKSAADGGMSRFAGEVVGDYELEPMVCGGFKGGDGGALVYDKTTKSIKALAAPTSSVLTTLPDVGHSLYPEYEAQVERKINNIDMNLKYCGKYDTGEKVPPMGMAEGYGVALFLFEKNNQPDSLFLYHVSIRPLAAGMYHNMVSLFEVDTLKNINTFKKADFYATHLSKQYMYYAKDNKVYSYDYAQKDMPSADLGFDYGGEEITYMRHVKWTLEDVADYNFDCLVVGTYKDGRYKLYFHNLSGVTPMDGTKMILEGEGKVKSFVYSSATSNIGAFSVFQ